MFNSVFLVFRIFFNCERKGGREEHREGRKEKGQEGGRRPNFNFALYLLGRTALTFKEHHFKGSAAKDFSPISKAL